MQHSLQVLKKGGSTDALVLPFEELQGAVTSPIPYAPMT